MDIIKRIKNSKRKTKLLLYAISYLFLGLFFALIIHSLIEISYLNWALGKGTIVVFYGNCALPPIVQVFILVLGLTLSFFFRYHLNLFKKIYIFWLSLMHFLFPKLYKVKCNVCGWYGEKFVDFDCGYGHIYVNSTCPNCLSQPRHRSFFLYLKKVIPTNKQIKVLHFAPEPLITKLFKSYKNIDYLSVDIDKNNAMRVEDITHLSFSDSSFDIIFCSHVLEHVENDKNAMSELYRVLKKGGFAIIDVPIDTSRAQTYEDFSIISPEERTKAFWQFDHVRLYGNDFPDKLRGAGFKVKADMFISTLDKSKIDYFGLEDGPIYFCEKE